MTSSVCTMGCMSPSGTPEWRRQDHAMSIGTSDAIVQRHGVA
jgi:hypothetical protein